MSNNSLQWLSESDFEKRYGLEVFHDPKYITGLILESESSLYDAVHIEINEPQYSRLAWRWFGVCNDEPFALDVAENHTRSRTPYFFYVYTPTTDDWSWEVLITFNELLAALGVVRVDHISRSDSNGQYRVFRDLKETPDDAKVIYRSADEAECMKLKAYLLESLNDSLVFVGH